MGLRKLPQRSDYDRQAAVGEVLRGQLKPSPAKQFVAGEGFSRKVQGVNNMLKRFFKEEAGQGMTEYGLIIALVAIAVIAVLIAMGGKLTSTFQRIVDSLV